MTYYIVHKKSGIKKKEAEKDDFENDRISKKLCRRTASPPFKEMDIVFFLIPRNYYVILLSYDKSCYLSKQKINLTLKTITIH